MTAESFYQFVSTLQEAVANGELSKVRRKLLTWYKKCGRHDLAWRIRPTPYNVLVSEIMLQQTQVSRVKEKFTEFLRHFPNFQTLAIAEPREVLALWSGLGYNRRALNLKKAASQIFSSATGEMPRELPELIELAGIGEYTAQAILAFAFDEPALAFDTNLRTLATFLFFPKAEDVVADTALKQKLILLSPKKSGRDWNYALMDLGSALKTSGLAKGLNHKKTRQSTFKGSNREARGAVIRTLSSCRGSLSLKRLVAKTNLPEERVLKGLEQLVKEMIVAENGGKYRIAG